jgi:hypothetical protein
LHKYQTGNKYTYKHESAHNGSLVPSLLGSTWCVLLAYIVNTLGLHALYIDDYTVHTVRTHRVYIICPSRIHGVLSYSDPLFRPFLER